MSRAWLQYLLAMSPYDLAEAGPPFAALLEKQRRERRMRLTIPIASLVLSGVLVVIIARACPASGLPRSRAGLAGPLVTGLADSAGFLRVTRASSMFRKVPVRFGPGAAGEGPEPQAPRRRPTGVPSDLARPSQTPPDTKAGSELQ